MPQATIGSTPPDSVAACWSSLAPVMAFAVSSGTFTVFRCLASGVIWKDYMATPESWSLLQSDDAVRDQNAASRNAILPLVRFIQTPLRRTNLTVSTPGTQARHRSPVTTPTNHVPPSWFFTTATVYSTFRPQVCCNLCRPWGSIRFESLLSARQTRRLTELGITRPFPHRGSYPPKNPPRQ